jgi:hypothetical protein
MGGDKGANIGRKTTKDNWDGMIMGTMGGWESLGFFKYGVVLG